MRKVSNTMLAVIAALQGGAHTRRKPLYLQEGVLVSHLYPIDARDRSSVYVYCNTNNHKRRVDVSAVSVVVDAEIFSSKKLYDLGVSAFDGGVDFSIDATLVRSQDAALNIISKKTVTVGFDIDLQIKRPVDVETIAKGDYAASVAFLIDITKG